MTDRQFLSQLEKKSSETTEEIIDRQLITTLRLETEAETFTILLKTFIDEISTRTEKSLLSAKQGNWTEVALHAHTLKSTSASIGAKQLEHTARALEFSARNQNTENALTLIDELPEVTDKTVKTLQIILKQEY